LFASLTASATDPEDLFESENPRAASGPYGSHDAPVCVTAKRRRADFQLACGFAELKKPKARVARFGLGDGLALHPVHSPRASRALPAFREWTV
jgi:hypothetical protein